MKIKKQQMNEEIPKTKTKISQPQAMSPSNVSKPCKYLTNTHYNSMPSVPNLFTRAFKYGFYIFLKTIRRTQKVQSHCFVFEATFSYIVDLWSTSGCTSFTCYKCVLFSGSIVNLA